MMCHKRCGYFRISRNVGEILSVF